MTKQIKTKKFLQWPVGKTAQDIQDDIFRRMTADKKIELVSQMWQFARELSGVKGILYGANRSKKTFN